jgi:ferrochelatase
VPASRPFDAVFLVSFGGPLGPADVRPFLQNVLRGRRIPPQRIEEVVEHYARFGGISPITALTMRQARGLEERLAASGLPLPVRVGMRNWHPLIEDTLERMGREGLRRAIAFPTAAHRCYSSCGQYRQNVLQAREALRRRGAPDVEVVYVGDWHTHPGFVAANAAHVREALERLPARLRDRARLVFTAHSMPLPLDAPYVTQLLESARLVADAAGRHDWTLVYQSRSGRPEDPWLEPDVRDFLREEHARGLVEAVVLCPIGFLCDHIEVLFDLDTDAAAVCRELGLPMARAESVNDDPLFLDAMADIVRATWDRYRTGRPIPLVSFDTPQARELPPVAR